MTSAVYTSARPCPICGKFEAENLHTIHYHSFAGHLPDQYIIVACRQCGMIFNDTHFTLEDYNRYYSEGSKYDAPQTEGSYPLSPVAKERYDHMCEFMIPHLSPNSRIVEMGCGQAGLLQRLNAHGYKNLLGVDPSPVCVNLVNSIGIKALPGTFLNSPDLGKCDCIAVAGVLEHLFDPRRMLKALDRYCHDETYLFVAVPSAIHYGNSIKTPYYHFDQEHINHFSLEHADNLLAGCGYRRLSHTYDVYMAQNIETVNLLVLYQKTGNPAPLRYSPDLRDKIINYLRESAEYDFTKIIDRLFHAQTPLYIWGCGANLGRLLKETELAKCNIQAFIDNDPGKQSTPIFGHPVFSSRCISKLEPSCTVVISSPFYRDLMTEELKSSKFAGEIIYLC